MLCIYLFYPDLLSKILNKAQILRKKFAGNSSTKNKNSCFGILMFIFLKDLKISVTYKFTNLRTFGAHYYMSSKINQNCLAGPFPVGLNTRLLS